MGFFSDIGGDLIGDVFSYLQQEDSQDFAQEQGVQQRAFNAEQAQAQRDWEERMSNTAITRRVTDLRNAGINPLLAWSGGGASTPVASAATSGIASAGIAPAQQIHSMSQAAANASAVAVNDANAKKLNAEADRTVAEQKEIEARTPTYAVNMDKLRQDITESQQRIQKIIQETETSAASASNIAQQTQNLKAAIPQIEATVQQLKAVAAKNWAETGLTQAQHAEVKQRVQANLPAIDSALKELQRQKMKIEQPTLEMTHDVTGHGFLGALSTTLKALNPFNDFFRSQK